MPTNFQQLQAQAKALVATELGRGLTVRAPEPVRRARQSKVRTTPAERRARAAEAKQRYLAGLPTLFRRTKRMVAEGKNPLGGREFAPGTKILIESLRVLPVAKRVAEDRHVAWEGPSYTLYRAAEAAGVRVEAAQIAGVWRVFRVL